MLFLSSKRTGLLRLLATGLLFLGNLTGTRAATALPLYEPFPTSYTNNARLRDLASFDAGNSAGSGSNLTNSWTAGLAYPGLLTDTNSGGCLANGTPTSARDAGIQIVPNVTVAATNPAVYASFLLKVTTMPTTTNLLVILAGSTGGSASPIVGVCLDNNAKLWLLKNSNTPITNTTATVSLNTTNLIVFRYHYDATGGDEVALWLNPASLGDDGNIPAPILTTTNGNDGATVAAVDFCHRTTSGSAIGATGTKLLDELRVATNWAGVTPSGSVIIVPSSGPVITNVDLTATSVVLQGTNGVANGFYRVLATSNPGLAASNWPALTTNVFDLNGNFNAVADATPSAQFYRIYSPGGGTPPSITAQPVAKTVVEGSNATFSVTSTGSATLVYQWLMAGSPIAGAQASTFTVTNAQADDVGTYSVVVSNAYGLATSAGAALDVIIPPSIAENPLGQTVNAGQAVQFDVLALGTAPLRYQWYFNTNTALAGATNATYSLAAAQATNAGTYSVRVTNTAGAVTSAVAVLNANTGPTPPSLTTPPSAQNAVLGATATFTVVASGSQPLVYQWYYNTNTALAAGTNASLVLSNVQFTNAGQYSVRVTNLYGSITSTPVALTVVSNVVTPDFSLFGFATRDGFSSNKTLFAGGTIGGSNGPIVLVNTLTQLVNYATKSNQALRILILTNIDMGPLNNNDNPTNILQVGKIQILSHKTIYSTNGATISHGSFHVIGRSNVVIRNLKFRDLYFDNSGADPGFDNHDWDYVRVDGGNHVWVDHCDFVQSYDGMVDLKNGADYITVSWCKFAIQKKASLVGSSDTTTSDLGHLNVTFHHNWYEDVNERIPRMRFGNAHVYNIYYANAHAAGKCASATAYTAMLMENSFFTNAPGAYPTVFVNGGLPANALKVTGCTIVNSSGNRGFAQTNQATFTFNTPWPTNAPPYPYVLDATTNVPYIVTNWAGVNKLTSY